MRTMIQTGWVRVVVVHVGHDALLQTADLLGELVDRRLLGGG